MPSAPPARAFTRREGLLALALAGPVALLAGCTNDADEPAEDLASATGGADTASAAAADEAALVARYEAALSEVPEDRADLREALAEIRDQHRAHLSALGGADEADATAGAPATAGTSALLASLIEAERAAFRDRVRACVDARDPEQARLLSLIAASEAAHVPALRDLREPGAQA